MFEVCFQYDEPTRKWEVVVKGATNDVEARQGFNAVVITMRDAIPKLEANKATLLENGSYKISVGGITAIAKSK